MPFSANVLKIRWFTPMTPTMPKPVIVIKQVSLIERNTLDRFRRMVGFLLHNSARSLRIERILYQNRNILMTYRINRRRIHHFRTKVTQLHSLHITQLRNRISRADDTRVSCHEAIHIRPDFQNIRIQAAAIIEAV